MHRDIVIYTTTLGSMWIAFIDFIGDLLYSLLKISNKLRQIRIIQLAYSPCSFFNMDIIVPIADTKCIKKGE